MVRPLAALSLFLLPVGCEAPPTKPTERPSAETSAETSAAPSAATGAATGAAPRLTGSLFAIDSYRRARGSCDGPGTDTAAELDGHTHLFLYRVEILRSRSMLAIGTCKTAEACRSAAAADHAKTPPDTQLAYSFTEEKAADRWTGVFTMTGYGKGDGTCREAKSLVTEVVLEGDQLTLTARGAQGDIPADERGQCSTRAAGKELTGKPCNFADTVKAHLVGPLTLP